MKKLIALLMIIITLSSCSVQEKMNTQIFVERFMKNNVENEFSINEIFSHDDSDKIYLNDKNGKEHLIEIYSDKNRNIYKITLTGEGLFENFSCLCKKITETYSPDISYELVLKDIFVGSYNYTETQWYYVTSAKKDNILFFSIENKKLTSAKNTSLTLKSNDITITKGSE